MSIDVGRKQPFVLNCFAGCSYEAILQAIGLDPEDLKPEREPKSYGKKSASAKRPITLKQLAEDKALPIDFLLSVGLHDPPAGGVGIPYHDEQGTTRQVKRCTALVVREGSYWPAGKPLMPYGLEGLAEARETGFFILHEGESDRWTLKYHWFSSLGIAGADATKTLEAEHVQDIPKLYIIQEPDQGGKTFVEGRSRRLREFA